MKKFFVVLSSCALLLAGCGVSDANYFSANAGRNIYLSFIDKETSLTYVTYELSKSGPDKIKNEVETILGSFKQYYDFAFNYSNGDEFEFTLNNWRKHYEKYGPDHKEGLWVWEQKNYMNVYSSYVAKSFKITYSNVEGADISNLPTTYTIESSATLPTISKPNYDFAGWYNGDTPITSLPLTSPSDINLTARWTAKSYSITYEGLYDIKNNDNPAFYSVDDGVINLKAIPSTKAYDFKGWKLDGQYVTSISASELGRNIVLVADFDFHDFSVDYYVDGSLYKHDTFNYLTFKNYQMPTVPNKEHYDPGKWDKKVEDYQNYEIRAIYSATVYTITYNLPFAISNPNPTSYTYFDSAIALTPFSDVAGQYTFDGFYLNGVKITSIDTSLGTNLVIEARFTYVDYTAKYYVNGNLYQTVTFNITNLNSVAAPNVPYKAHYNGAWDQQVRELKNYEINAVYTPIIYNITYNLPFTIDNPNPVSYTVEDTSMVLTPFQDLDGAYTFDGFYLNGTKITAVDTSMGTNLTIDVRFNFVEYHVKYYVDGNLYLDNILTYATLANYAEPAVPALPHHNNGRWDDNVTTLKDYTIHAVYELEKFTVHIITNANIDAYDEVVEYGTSLAPLYAKFDDLNVPDRSFDAFYDSTNSETPLDKDFVIESDMTIYARFDNAKRITTHDQLLAMDGNYSGAYVLDEDIDCLGDRLPALSSFKGKFNGRGHTISNFAVGIDNVPANSSMFGTNNGTIKNVNFANGSYTSQGGSQNSSTSLIAGINNGTISNVNINNCSVYITSYPNGGTNAGTFHFVNDLGVISGLNNGVIEDCKVDKLSTAKFRNATYCWNNINDVKYRYDTFSFYNGVIAGRNTGKIRYVTSEAKVTGELIKQLALTDSLEMDIGYGGIVGKNDPNGLIEYAQRTGDVTFVHSQTHSNNENQWFYNGVVVWKGICNEGNIAGINNGRIVKCYASGNVELRVNNYCYVGGAVGRNNAGGSVQLTYVRNSAVKADNTYNNDFGYIAGGLIGANEGSVSYSYVADVNVIAVSDDKGGNRIGGLAGLSSGTINNSFVVANLQGFDSTIAGAIKNGSGSATNCYSYVTNEGGDVTGFFNEYPLTSFKEPAFLDQMYLAKAGFIYVDGDYPIINFARQ